MVRVNIINPASLSDQHLVAEYDEILMLAAYARKYKSLSGIPPDYCLGKGHMKFFKDKIVYLKKRHELLKMEMRRRGFATRKTIALGGFSKAQLKSWKPGKSDFVIIKRRIIQKLRKKPEYYRYYGQHRKLSFFVGLIKKA